MKHTLSDANVKLEIVDISTDVETVIDKVTESALIIIAALTASRVVKSFFK